MRVCEQGDIGNRVIGTREERLRGEMPFHHGERLRAALAQPRQIGTARVIRRQPAADEARDGDIRLVTVLLEEQPLQHLGPAVDVLRDELGHLLGEIEQDGARFEQADRDAAARFLGLDRADLEERLRRFDLESGSEADAAGH